MDSKIIPQELRGLSDIDALRTLDNYLVSAMQLSALLRERLHAAHPNAFHPNNTRSDSRAIPLDPRPQDADLKQLLPNRPRSPPFAFSGPPQSQDRILLPPPRTAFSSPGSRQSAQWAPNGVALSPGRPTFATNGAVGPNRDQGPNLRQSGDVVKPEDLQRDALNFGSRELTFEKERALPKTRPTSTDATGLSAPASSLNPPDDLLLATAYGPESSRQTRPEHYLRLERPLNALSLPPPTSSAVTARSRASTLSSLPAPKELGGLRVHELHHPLSRPGTAVPAFIASGSSSSGGAGPSTSLPRNAISSILSPSGAPPPPPSSDPSPPVHLHGSGSHPLPSTRPLNRVDEGLMRVDRQLMDIREELEARHEQERELARRQQLIQHQQQELPSVHQSANAPTPYGAPSTGRESYPERARSPHAIRGGSQTPPPSVPMQMHISPMQQHDPHAMRDYRGLPPPPQPHSHSQSEHPHSPVHRPVPVPVSDGPGSVPAPLPQIPPPNRLNGALSPSNLPTLGRKVTPALTVNAQGQRTCQQCHQPGRYKDGRCIEKWGPGPAGPGTVCDRCRKRMKRVERRNNHEATLSRQSGPQSQVPLMDLNGPPTPGHHPTANLNPALNSGIHHHGQAPPPRPSQDASPHYHHPGEHHRQNGGYSGPSSSNANGSQQGPPIQLHPPPRHHEQGEHGERPRRPSISIPSVAHSFDFDGRGPPPSSALPGSNYPRDREYNDGYYDGPSDRDRRGPPTEAYSSQHPTRASSPYETHGRRHEFIIDERHFHRPRQSAARDSYEQRSPGHSDAGSDDEDEDELRNDDYSSRGQRGRPRTPQRSSYERHQPQYHRPQDGQMLRIPYDARPESRTPSLNTSSTEGTFVGPPPLSSSSDALSNSGGVSGIKRKRSISPNGHAASRGRSRSLSPNPMRSRSGSGSSNHISGPRRSMPDPLPSALSRKNSRNADENREDDHEGWLSKPNSSSYDPSKRPRRRISPTISALGLNINASPQSLNRSRTSSARLGSGDDVADASDNEMAA